MTSDRLNTRQRLVASVFYLILLVVVLRVFSKSFSFLGGNTEYGFMFVSAALLLVFGTYITEPYFTKPVDTITNSTAILIALFGISNKDRFILYEELVLVTAGFLILGLFTVLINNQSESRWQNIMYKIVTTLGRSKVAFSVLYLLTLLSFFTENSAEFWGLLTFWIILLGQFVVEPITLFIWKLFSNDSGYLELGKAIGRENPYLFKIRVDKSKNTQETGVGNLVYVNADNGMGLVGVIANEKILLTERWLTVYLIQKGVGALCIDLRTKKLTETDKLFSSSNKVFSLHLNDISEKQRKLIMDDVIYKGSAQIVGYVAPGSNISRVRFETLPDLAKKDILIQEGTILKIKVNSVLCLYQVVDANTDEEKLETHNSTGFTVGIAQKLGKYTNTTKELDVVKWLPDIYSPVFAMIQEEPHLLDNSIGLLPGTNLGLEIKDYNSLVTHNTAILGILGIGKSSLTFELLQKVVMNTGAKVICIDITNEYINELPSYINSTMVVDDLTAVAKASLKTGSTRSGANNRPSDWGNESDYKTTISDTIESFCSDPDKRVLILNPDLHAVTKPASQFNISEHSELSIAQKTRFITERAFVYTKSQWEITGTASTDAKLLLVFEEAHSLIPEWNSSANDGDQQASNGTAKVIMQGRKYGLGSLVVTQRTANISKSILNQCNTIFAMRVFDDTGKQFLENYVGSDYANALPTLAERHAVVVGKALRLKQPVILQLNDKELVVQSIGESLA